MKEDLQKMVTLYTHVAMLAIGLAFTAAAKADDPARLTSEKLLTTLWDKQANHTVDIPDLYQQALRQSAGTPELFHAYALNRIHYFRYRDALPIAEQWSAAQPEAMEAWLMRAWLNGILGRFDRMAVELQMVAERFDAANQSGRYQRVELERFAARLGRLYGFLEGPAKDDVAAASLRDVLREVERALDDELFQIFDDQRQDIVDQFVRAANDRSQALVQADQDWQIKSQQEMANLDAAQDQLNQRRDQVQQEITRVRSDGRQQLAELDSRLEPLRDEARTVSRRLSGLEWSWQIVAQNLAHEEACLAREKDPLLRSIILARIQQLQWQLRGIEADLFAFRGQLATLQQQLRALESQRFSLAQSLDQQVAVLQGEINQIQRTQRQNQNRREKLARSSAPVPTAARVIGDQIKVLGTYDPFPVEMERQRLLRALQQPKLVGD